MKHAEIQLLLNELNNILKQEAQLEQNKLELAFKQGAILQKLKSFMPYGQFQSLLESDHIKIHPRKAQRLMKLKANEDLIRAQATDLSQLSVDKALKIVAKEEKKIEDIGAEQKQVIKFHELKIRSSFNKFSQQYEILLCFNSDELPMAQHRKNQLIITDAIERLKLFLAKPCLTDLSTLSQN